MVVFIAAASAWFNPMHVHYPPPPPPHKYTWLLGLVQTSTHMPALHPCNQHLKCLKIIDHLLYYIIMTNWQNSIVCSICYMHTLDHEGGYMSLLSWLSWSAMHAQSIQVSTYIAKYKTHILPWILSCIILYVTQNKHYKLYIYYYFG